MSDVETRWLGADSILFATAHRPWPLPTAPWVMTQLWKDLLFLHYPVDPEILRPLVPDALRLDTYEHRAWVSVAPFLITRLRPPGVPAVPWLSSFPELNVRTYVTYGDKPGVFLLAGCGEFVGGVGRAGVLQAALLACRYEDQRKRLDDCGLPVEADPRAEACGVCGALWADGAGEDGEAGVAGIVFNGPVLPVCVESEEVISGRDSSFAVAVAGGESGGGDELDGGSGGDSRG